MRVLPLAVLALAWVLLTTLGGFTSSPITAGEKVTICHATGSESNPFVEVTVSQASIDSGHNPHAVHVGDYIGKCEVLTSSIEITPAPEHNTHNTHEPVASSISQAPAPTPTPTPSLPLSLPRSGGAPE